MNHHHFEVGFDQKGQSLLEFLMVLPLLVGFAVMMIRINSAIQVSIVNQKYARSQALWLAFNSPFYPRIEQKIAMADQGSSQMVLGVSDNLGPSDGLEYNPSATTQMISRTRSVQGSEAPGEEPNSRSQVRVRGTVTLCTEPLVTEGASGLVPVRRMGGSPATGYFVDGKVNLNEGTQFKKIFCGSSMNYEQ